MSKVSIVSPGNSVLCIVPFHRYEFTFLFAYENKITVLRKSATRQNSELAF